MIQFTILGEPRGKGRPRFTRQGHAYTDAKTKAYEGTVKKLARNATGGVIPYPDGGVEVVIHTYTCPPASASKSKREAMLSGRLPVTKKPDVDNIVKAILDACNGILYRDDAQIVILAVGKHYDILPRVEVEIKGWEDEQ